MSRYLFTLWYIPLF